MIMMCQWRFISCNKCATLVWVVDNGEFKHGARGYVESLRELKTAPKDGERERTPEGHEGVSHVHI